MTWFPDMGHESLGAVGDHVRAVGWLHPDHSFSRGEAPPEFVDRLKAFARCGCHCAGELCWGICMGFHTCEFCGNARGVRNLGVPAGSLLFVAPDMVAHYVEQHQYAPPAEFIAAVLASPLPGTPEYTAAVAGFRQIHQEQVETSAIMVEIYDFSQGAETAAAVKYIRESRGLSRAEAKKTIDEVCSHRRPVSFTFAFEIDAGAFMEGMALLGLSCRSVDVG